VCNPKIQSKHTDYPLTHVGGNLELEVIAEELAESELAGIDREGISKLARLYTKFSR